MRVRGVVLVSSIVAACGQSAPPPSAPPLVAPPVVREVAPQCKALTTLAAYLGEHVEAGNEGATDRQPPEVGEPAEPLTPQEQKQLEAERRANDPLGGAVLGDGACMLTGQLGTAADAILAAPVPATSSRAGTAKAKPDRLALVDASLRLTKAESAKLAEQGLVALDRFAFADYATALYEVYRRDLPLYVGLDPILHAHYVAHDSFLADIEQSRLAATTAYLLESLACALPGYAAKVSPDTARDLDLYVTTARVLLSDENVASALGDADTERRARELAARARVGKAMAPEQLFGRERMVDWTQFVPRGHYAPDTRPSALPRHARDKNPRGDYFRALMWLTRIELDLGGDATCAVSAMGPGPADRDTLLAFALVDLVHAAGADDALADLDRAWSELGGAPEAARFGALAEIRAATRVELTDAKAAERLRAAVDGKFLRTVRTSYVAAACTGMLPAVTSLIAPRVGIDARAMMPLGRDGETADAASIAYLLGHDVAVPQPTNAQRGARAVMVEARERAAPSGTASDAYSAWLDAILAIADVPAGVVPAAFTSEAGKARRAESALVGYAQLRSANILLSASTYDEDACSIPDAYVEPAPAVFGKLAAMADQSAELARDHAMPMWVAQFARMAKIDRVLAKIAEHELTGAPLTADMQRFLGMVVEIHLDAGYGGTPMFNGWFFDLFRHVERDAFHPAAFDIDVFTSTKTATVTKIGADGPVFGVFTIETNGVRRVVVGPIARGVAGLVGERVRRPRRHGRGRDTADLDAVPWRSRYAIETPPLYAKVTARFELPPESPKRSIVVDVQTDSGGAFTIELLGANRRPVATKKLSRTGEGVNETRFPLPKTLSAIHVQQGESHAWIECRANADTGPECDTHVEQDPKVPSKRPDFDEPGDDVDELIEQQNKKSKP